MKFKISKLNKSLFINILVLFANFNRNIIKNLKLFTNKIKTLKIIFKHFLNLKFELQKEKEC